MKSGSGEWLSIEDLMEKISNKSFQERKMSQANHLSYSARMRGRSKQPIYTSDKRAKFTQKENKKWVRLLTVIGYIIAVSLPALSLSFYYIYVWDQNQATKNTTNSTTTSTTTTTEPPIITGPVHVANIQLKNGIEKIEQKTTLSTLLNDAMKSMESGENLR